MPAIDTLFEHLLKNHGSDLHLSQDQPPKTRLHGSVLPVRDCPVLSKDTLRDMMREICPADRWAAFEECGDLDFAYAYADKARFRANYLKQYAGYGAVFRIIPQHILTLEDLHAPKVLHTFADFPSGLCLVTGPTGSGKSTTLAAIIDSINTRQKKVILTIEEPIEFVHPTKQSTIIQREVGSEAHSFKDALSVASRQDVDVILVGEMRDKDTIGLAVHAGEMGTLVFGTLHTNSASKTIYRILDVFPGAQQRAIRESLSVALRAVCAQLLVKRSDREGRIAVHEILLQTRATSNLIREGKPGQIVQVIMTNRSMGMQLMDDGIENLLNQRIISGTEAYMKAFDKERFKKFAPGGAE